MENTTPTIKTGIAPKDFFFWGGAIIALYVSIGSFIALLFAYIDKAFPDVLQYSYGDPYSGTIRFSMASLIVLVPTLLILFRLIRNDIEKHAEKAHIWVRRWALVFTLFLAVVTLVIDLITLLTSFFNGDITTAFLLKVGVVLLVAAGVFMHFLADLKGYWLVNPPKVKAVSVAVGILVALSILSGFLIIGTPAQARLIRYDAQKSSDLQGIQYQITSYWQAKQTLPNDLASLGNTLQYYTVPVDPQDGTSYEYKVVGDKSFELCATFNRESDSLPATDVMYTAPVKNGMDENWKHGTGRTCFTRTIDPAFYPPLTKGPPEMMKGI